MIHFQKKTVMEDKSNIAVRLICMGVKDQDPLPDVFFFRPMFMNDTTLSASAQIRPSDISVLFKIPHAVAMCFDSYMASSLHDWFSLEQDRYTFTYEPLYTVDEHLFASDAKIDATCP